MDQNQISRNGWRVTLAGTGINLALGILYTWSVLKSAMAKEWGWNAASTALPYSVAVLTFAFATVPAGRLQDKFGPKWIASFGGLLVGLGCIVASLSGASLAGVVVGFGILTGAGIGFAYACATPPAVKWFPGSKTGKIAGIVVAGFGLASVYAAPLATYLAKTYGISKTLLVLGVVFLVIVVVLAQLLRNPSEDVMATLRAPQSDAGGPKRQAMNVQWREMIKRRQFWVLWLMFFCGAGVGLMIIGTATTFGKAAFGSSAFVVVVILAIGNAGGRVLAGIVSDKIGRQRTLFGAFMLQAIVVIGLIFVRNQTAFLTVAILLAGANYGANLSLFPAASKDYFGLKGFGLNYGILFTSWGVGGFLLSYLNGRIVDAFKGQPGSGDEGRGLMYSLIAAAVLLVAAALLSRVRATAAHRKPTSIPVPQTA